jgi:hypothetical protein
MVIVGMQSPAPCRSVKRIQQFGFHAFSALISSVAALCGRSVSFRRYRAIVKVIVQRVGSASFGSWMWGRLRKVSHVYANSMGFFTFVVFMSVYEYICLAQDREPHNTNTHVFRHDWSSQAIKPENQRSSNPAQTKRASLSKRDPILLSNIMWAHNMLEWSSTTQHDGGSRGG